MRFQSYLASFFGRLRLQLRKSAPQRRKQPSKLLGLTEGLESRCLLTTTHFNVGTLSTNPAFFADSVQGTNDDLFHFDLAKASDLTMTLTGLNTSGQGKDIVLGCDLNANDLIDSNEVVETANNLFASFTRTEPLSPGKYLLQVTASNSNFSPTYTLNLQATPIAGAQDAGQNMALAENVGIVSTTPTSLVDVVQTGDVDVYRFQLTSASDLSASFVGLSEPVKVILIQDLNGDQQNGTGETLHLVNITSLSAGQGYTLSDSLEPGEYFIQIAPYNTNNNTSYTLNLSAIPIPDAQDAGETLATARNAGPLTTTLNTFVDVIQNGDIDVYRFQLSTQGTLTASIADLTEPIKLELIQDKNGNSVIDTLETLQTVNVSQQVYSLTKSLAAGEYFIRIRPYNIDDNSKYRLILKSDIIPQPPSIAGFDTALSYTENGPALVLDGDATVTDVDSIDFDSGTLRVRLLSNADTNDLLEIRNQGTASGQIGVNGSDITFSGITIGSFVGGVGVNELVVTLNANATPLIVQTLLRNVTYRNSSDNPSTLLRTVQVSVSDGDTGVSNLATKTISVTAVNDVPVAQTSTVVTVMDTAKSFSISNFLFTDAENDSLASIRISGLSLASGDTLTVNLGAGAVAVTNGMIIPAAQISTMIYTPAAGMFGIGRSTFQFFANDTGSGVVSATMRINVSQGNQVPVALVSSVTVAGDTIKTFSVTDFLFTDPDGDSLASIKISGLNIASGDTLTVTQGAATVAVTNGMTISAAQIATLKYTPAVGANGVARSTFDFTVNDTGVGTVAATMTITVTPANQPPVAQDSVVTTSEDTPKTFAVSNFPFTDFEGNGLASISISGVNLASGDSLTVNLGAGPVAITTGMTIPTNRISSMVYVPATNSNGNNRSSFQFTANDGKPGTISSTMTINVTAVNDVPVALARDVTTLEDTPRTFAVSDFQFTDAENDPLTSITIRTVSMAVGDTLTVDLGTGPVPVTNGITISAATIPTLIYTPATDAVGINRSQFTFTVNDIEFGTIEAVLSINVTGVNETPTGLSMSQTTLPENRPNGSFVGTFSTVDPDATDTFTYTLVSGPGSADNSHFVIINNQLATAGSFDFESRTTYSIRVRTTDQDGLSFENGFTIAVTDVNETPTDIALSSSAISENLPGGTVVGALSTFDPDLGNTFNYTLVTGVGSTDNSFFTISNGQLLSAGTLNYEARNSFAIRIRSTDQSGLSFEKPFTISVLNVNEAPLDLTLSNTSIAENLPAGSRLATLNTIDTDLADTFTYSLVSGIGSTDNSNFVISNGQILTANSFDFESRNTYSIRIRTTDQDGLTFEKPFTVSVTNVNEAPNGISLTASSIAENRPAGANIGILSATDSDSASTFTYTLVAGPGSSDNSSFTIISGQLRAIGSFDFETQNQYSVRVRATDQGGLFFEKTFNIAVTDANESPTDLTLSATSVDENSPSGTIVGTLITTDSDASSAFVYSFVAGAGGTDNSFFSISNGKLVTNASFDYETQPSYSVRVRTTDQGGLSFDKPLTILVTNRNEAPSGITLSATSISENVPAGSVVGTWSASDPDLGDSLTYTLVPGAGSTDNVSFTIVNGQLQTATSFDFETHQSLSIRVRATDQGGLSVEKSLTVAVTNLNEAPSLTPNQNFTINENSAINAVVGTVLAVDPDTAPPFSTRVFSILNGNTGDVFAIDPSTGQLTVKSSSRLDFETNPVYTLTLALTDGAGAAAVATPVTIHVADVNEAPTVTSISAQSISEDGSTGPLSFVVADPETPVGNLTVQVSSSNPSLIPDSNLILTGTGPDRGLVVTPAADQAGTATITLTVGDGVNLSTQSFQITVIGMNDVPQISSFLSQVIQEDTSTTPLAFTINDVDNPVSSLVVSATSSNTALIPNSALMIQGSGQNRTLVATPTANQSGATQITVTVSDGTLTTSQTFDITVTGVDDPPAISLNSQPLIYRVSSKQIVSLDSTATIGDVDSPNLNLTGSRLEVSGQSTKDQLTILKQGGVSIKGKSVLYNGSVIGTLQGGKKGVALTINFNGSATLNAVQALVSKIGFKSTSKTFGARTLQLRVSNVTGISPFQATREINVIS